MAIGRGTDVRQRAVARYVQRTPRARALFERGLQSLPAGTTRGTAAFFPPYPIYIKEGHGCHVIDVDGYTLLDCQNCFTATILGHGHPAIVEAVTRQVALGTAYSAPNEHEIELAEALRARVPSLAHIRFGSAGSEAPMFALRAARRATGRPKIAKVEGGYHGTSDYASISVHPTAAQAGPATAPRAVLESAGVPPAIVNDVVVLPFNDAAAASRLIEQQATELAAVIVEPVLGSSGMIPPEDGYLQALRALTARHGIVLIFDEIISLRLGPGGAQEYYGVRPDLTTFGKIVGGGFPLSGIGGRVDLMAAFDPREPHGVPQGGTFNGNPISMVAGLAALQVLTPAVYRRLEALGDELRARLTDLFRRRAVPVQVTGVASLFNLHVTRQPVRDYRSAASKDADRQYALFLALLEAGVLLAPKGAGSLSTPMGPAEIDAVVGATAWALDQIEWE